MSNTITVKILMPLSRPCSYFVMIAAVMFSACSNNTPAKDQPVAEATNEPSQTVNSRIAAALSAEISRQYQDLKVSVEDDKVKIGDSLFLEGNINGSTDHGEVKVLELNIVATHPTLFAGGISDFLAGIGTSDTMAIRTGVQAYVAGVLSTILHGLTNEHQPKLDFTVKKELWHPIAGPLQVQGAFSEDTTATGDDYHIFKLLKPVLVDKLNNSTDTLLHWMKVYVSRQEDHTIIVECEYDNTPLPEANEILKKYAADWKVKTFAGEKQFILLRRCGAHK